MVQPPRPLAVGGIVLAQLQTESPQDVIEPAVDQASELIDAVMASLPRVGVAVLIGMVLLGTAVVLSVVVQNTLRRSRADGVVVGLLSRIVRFALIALALLLALAVGGVPVSSALAGLAVAGVAVGLAIQGILENFIAGVILSFRQPFRAGDQIISGEFEGTAQEIDLRVTHLVDYDGRSIVIPNRDVYTNPLVNLTARGSRRTTVVVGVDYRDDHDAAREVLRAAVSSVDGVLPDPAPEVLLTELGESSVNFEIRYWTTPRIGEVRNAQDRVLAAAKRGIEDAGMTIPWPIRTLVPDGVFRHDRAGAE